MNFSLLLIVLFLFLVVAIEGREDPDDEHYAKCREKDHSWDPDTKMCSPFTSKTTKKLSTEQPPTTKRETTTSSTAPTTTITKKEEPGIGPNAPPGLSGCDGDQKRDEITNKCVPKETSHEDSDGSTESTTSSSQTSTTTKLSTTIKTTKSENEHSTTTLKSTSTETVTTTPTELSFEIVTSSEKPVSTSERSHTAYIDLGGPSYHFPSSSSFSQVESSTTASGYTTSPSKSTSLETTTTSPDSSAEETETDSSTTSSTSKSTTSEYTTTGADVTTTVSTTSQMETTHLETTITDEDSTTSADDTTDSSTTPSTSQSTISEPTTTGTDVTSTTTLISTSQMETTHLETTITDEDSTTTPDSTIQTDNTTSTTTSLTTPTSENTSSNTTSDNSFETATTPIKKEIWDLDPGEYPMEGMTIFLCPSPTTTTKLPTSSFTINPASDKVTSVETGFTYSTSQGPVSTSVLESSSSSEFSSGGTKPAEGTMSTTSTPTSESSSDETNTSENHGHGSPTTVLSTVTTSTTDRTSYGTSLSTVSSTSSASSRAQTRSSSSTSTMTSSDSETGTTASNAKEILSTETTGMRTSTPVETTSELSTSSGTTLPTSFVMTSRSSSDSTTSVTPHSSVPSSSASISTTSTEHVITSTTIASPSPTYSSQFTTSKTDMSSVSPSSSYSRTIDLEVSPSTGESSTFGNHETKQSTNMPQVSTVSQETYGTSESETEVTTIGKKSSSEWFTTSMEKETSLSSTGSDLPDTKSTISLSYSDVPSSTTTQKTTTTVISKEENSSSAIVSSTESIATTAHKNVETSAPTQTSMEESTENTETSTTEMSPSSLIEVTDNTESSKVQTGFTSVSSSSTGVFSSSTVSEVQYPTTSPDQTEKATPEVETSTLFRSETTEEETTDFSSSLSTVPNNVESTTKTPSTSGRSSKPTSSGLETSQESVATTTTEGMNSEPIPSKGTHAPTSSSDFTSLKTNSESSSKTTTGVMEASVTTVLQDESTQETSSTTFEIETEAAKITTESSPKTTSVPRTDTPSRNPDVETISSSSSKPTAGTVKTTTSVAHTNVESTLTTTSEQTDSSSAGPTTLSSTSTLPSKDDVITSTQQSPTSPVDSSSKIPLAKSTSAKMKSTTTGTLTTSGTKSSTVSNAKMTTSPKTTKNINAAPPLPTQSESSSSSFSTSNQVTSSGTPPSSAPSTSRQSTPSTTQDPLCKKQCPQGYLVGTSLCFQLVPASSRINSYQSALSYCKTTDRQTLASLDKIRDNSDIKIIQESAGLQNIDWIYANGIGSKQERFLKSASVYSIFSQSLVSSPILFNVGISEVFGNVSALCVLPQYCNSTECDVEKLFLAYEYYNAFKQTAGTLQPKQKGDVTCLYGNQKSTKVTCNSLGAIYPNPSNIDCEESAAERKIIDTTNQTVSSCKECFGRGTRECQEVLGENGNVEGYRCVCQEPFTMASCWRTENPCNSSYCGENGKCVSELGDVSCECDWGFTGEKCETQLAKKFDGDFGYSTITLGGILLRVLKVALMGFTLSNEQGDDPQDTHQRLRTYLMTGAGVIMCFYSNPTLLAISPSACRFYYVAIHFCYMMAMLQWLFEGWNVNQVLRCVHLNQWEIDWQGRRSWGVRIAPRMILSFLLTGTFLLITFQTGWNKLAASWTCVGVICQETLNIWIPVFSAVLIIVLFGGTVYESSIMIKYRRPLLGYKINMKIERELGREVGRRVQKCRENDSLSIIGLLLLVAQYISVIYSSDKRDEPLYGYITVVLSGIYSTFCSYQEIITCPEDRADFYKRLQRWFPVRFAPDYNPETMWTLPEVKEFYSVPKAEREARYENFLSRNEKLYIHHRWDVRINQIFLENKEEFKINDALVQIWHEEMRDLKAKNGTEAQKYVIQGVYADYMDTVPDKDPRDAGKLKGRLELVTLAAEDDKNGVRLAKFFIVPTFHTFTPEMPDSSHTPQNEIIRDHERRLMAQLDTDIYELTREASEEQKTFVNSAIVFWNYGNKVVR